MRSNVSYYPTHYVLEGSIESGTNLDCELINDK
jgi:hypothetical protein